MIDLTIKTLDSQNHTFSVPDAYTVLELKEHIVEKVNVPVIQQRLIFCGRVLSNETKLADIGIHGKVMHLVQKAPRLATTTSGASSSTTTNTNSRQGQNVAPGFRGWHAYDPTVVFGAIGIPSEFINAGELPRMINPRNTQTYNRISVAIDMVRKGHEILNRLENVESNGTPSTTDGEQIPEGSQQAESSLRNSPPESSTPQTQSDSDSVNVSYEVDDTFPNTVVVTIDATHHMRMSPGLMRHVHGQMQGPNLHTFSSSSMDQNVQRETTSVPITTSLGPPNQSSTEQTTRPSSGPPHDQNTRSTTTSVSERHRLRELIEQLNKLNSRLQPFYTLFCQYLVEDPQFESIQGERGSTRAQIVYNSVSEVLHYISHIYHLISDLRVSFSRPPNRLIQSRPYLMQGAILHTAHSVTTPTTATPPTTQQPTSTQTTNTGQSIPSVRAFRLDLMNTEVIGNETPSVSTSATTTANANVRLDSNIDRNNPSMELPTVPNGLSELLFDLAPGAIHIDAVEAAFINSHSSGSTPPDISQPPNSSETSNNSMPIDWVDQMIDVISSGVRRPFVSEQSLDWGSIPTTSTQTPRVTPRTADSSSTTNPPPSQVYGTRPTIPRADPYLPCNSFHFESNLRPVVLARRTQGTDRPTSSANNSNSTTELPMPVLAELRPGVGRRTGRPRARYVHDIDGFMSGIHPILNFGRNHRINPNAPPVSNNGQGTGQTAIPTDTMTMPGGHIRVDIGSVFDRIEREGFERGREINILQPPSGSGLGLETTFSAVPQSTSRQPNELLLAPIGTIPFFRRLEGRFLLLDLFLLIARDWTLHDLINLNTTDLDSSIVQYPVSRNSEALVNFFLVRIMRNQPPNNHSIEEAANRIFLEMVSYIHVFCSVPTRTNIDLNASIRRCILHNLRVIAVYCEENRATSTIDILPALILFAEALLSLIVYCCNNRAVFRICVGSLMQFLPLPPNLHQVIMDEIRVNVDQYWNNMASSFRMGFPVVDFVVPFDTNEFEAGQTSRVGNEERSANSTLTSREIANEPLPEVVIGSQEWHHSVPSEWVPVITRDTQRQRRQGAQPPYSDAYLSGMPNKRRKMVSSSKTQGSLSQIIANNLEVAMGAAGVTINKEVIAIVGADNNVQNAYTERIKSFGRLGLETHPDFTPDRYPNAFKFFCDRNCSN